MAKFIIFTNNNNVCFPDENPFEVMGLSDFGDTAIIALIGNTSPDKILVDSPTEFNNFKNYDILIHTDTTPEQSVISDFVDSDKDVYVLLHDGSRPDEDTPRKNSQKVVIKNILGKKFNNFIEQSHDSKSIYWYELVEIAKCISKEQFDLVFYNRILSKVKSYWHNLTLESLIRLHKTLSISLINNPSISIDSLKNQPKYELAFGLLDKVNSEQKGNVNEVLKWTSSKIIELSQS